MVRNDSATDGESQPRSLSRWLGRKEGLEESVLGALGDSWPVV